MYFGIDGKIKTTVEGERKRTKKFVGVINDVRLLDKAQGQNDRFKGMLLTSIRTGISMEVLAESQQIKALQAEKDEMWIAICKILELDPDKMYELDTETGVVLMELEEEKLEPMDEENEPDCETCFAKDICPGYDGNHDTH